MKRQMASMKSNGRILRHIRWQSSGFVFGHLSFPRIIWLLVMLFLAIYATTVQGFDFDRITFEHLLWPMALVGLLVWALGRFRDLPAAAWTGFYVAWIGLAGTILRVPSLTNVGRAVMVVGAITAILDMPSQRGFIAMALWSAVVGIATEYQCLGSFRGLRGASVGFLIYILVPFALVHNLGLLEKLYAGGLSDDLTGVGSRALLRWLRSSLWPRIERQGRSLSLLLLDIDDFKLVNDRLGHIQGDEVLRKFAQLIRSEIRHQDIICRYGGDEFVVFLLDATSKEAVSVANRLRRVVGDVFQKEYPDCPLTVSIGVASYPEDAQDMDSLLEAADKALLEGAKLQGKNQVATAASLRSPDPWEMVSRELPTDLLPLVEMTYLATEETVDHLSHLAELGYRLGKMLGLPEERCIRIVQGAALHDVGKLALPKAIWRKSGPLSQEEDEVARLHPELGVGMLANLGLHGPLIDTVRHHHEWWDGTGYPMGLKGEEIPMEAAILSVVGAYDDLTRDRTYGRILTPKEALRKIKALSGVQFSPIVVDKLEELLHMEGLVEAAASNLNSHES